MQRHILVSTASSHTSDEVVSLGRQWSYLSNIILHLPFVERDIFDVDRVGWREGVYC